MLNDEKLPAGGAVVLSTVASKTCWRLWRFADIFSSNLVKKKKIICGLFLHCKLLPTAKLLLSLFSQGASDRRQFSVLHPPAVWELHLLHLTGAPCTVSMMPRTSISLLVYCAEIHLNSPLCLALSLKCFYFRIMKISKLWLFHLFPM